MKIEQRSTDTSPLEAQRQVFPAPNQKLVRITPDRANAFSEAVQAATPHTTLILAPGRYVEEREVVISQQGLIVVSESKHAAKIFVASSLDRPFLCIEAADVVLVGIAIEDHRAAALDHQHVCVAIEPASNARIEGCEISAKFGTAIEAKGGSMPAVRDCIIHACIRGVVVMGTSNPRVTNCALSSCESCCIRVMGSASGIFADNKLSDAGDACFWAGGDSSSAFTHNMVGATHGCGVLLEENTRVRVENNDISSGHQNGIQAGDNADPFVQNNTIIGSRGSGIVLFQRAKGSYLSNNVHKCVLACVSVRDDAEPVFVGNTVSDGEGSGFVLLGRASGVFEGNVISRQLCAGIGVSGASSGFFDGNSIKENQRYGVWVQDTASGWFQNNVITKNGHAGFAVSGEAQPVVVGNAMSGAGVGILLQEKAGGEYRENKVSGNSAMNVLLDGECTGVLFDNVIVDGAGGGVLIKGESTASLIGNRVSANARANIALFENANPVVEQNSIQQGHGRGIVVTGSARGAIRYNVIRGHECEGVYVCGNATPSVTENVIGDSTGHGILIEDQARGEYFDNVLSDNSDGGVQHNPGPNSDRADADPVDASEHPGRPLAPGPDPLNLNANPTILRNVVTADPDPDRDSPPADPAALDVGHGPLPGLLGPRPGSGAPAGAGSFKLFRAGSARAWRTVLWQHFVQFVNPGAAKPTLFVVGCSTSPPESEASLLGRVPSGTDNVAAGVQSRDVTSSRRSSHADSAEPYWDIEGCHTAAPTGASTAPTGATEAPTGARAAPEPEARDCKSRSRGPGVTGAEEVKRRVTGGGHVTHPGHGRFTMLLRENSEPGTGATEFSSASRARPREDAAVCASG